MSDFFEAEQDKAAKADRNLSELQRELDSLKMQKDRADGRVGDLLEQISKAEAKVSNPSGTCVEVKGG